MTTEEAIAIVARHAIARAVERIEWEDYPEVGENDFEEIAKAAAKAAPFPPTEKYDEAYELLTARAEASESD